MAQILRPRARKVTLFQRRAGKFGKDLGKTTGWIHRLSLRRQAVRTIGGVTYTGIDADGLHYTDRNGPQTCAVDHVILCTGQDSQRDLYDQLCHDHACAHDHVHLIGGAAKAAEIDAKRAIDEGYRLAFAL